MTFLKKLGQIFQIGLQLFTGFAPILQQAIPGAAGPVQIVSKDLTELLNIIVAIEAAGQSLGLPGVDKLRMAAPQIMAAILGSAALVGKPLQDPGLALQGSTKVADGLADILNAVHPSAIIATPIAVIPVAPPAPVVPPAV
jgi:hypothetical protein